MLILVSCGNADIETQSKPADTTEMIAAKSTEGEDEVLSDEKKISERSKEQKILVAYFSWADNAEQRNIDAMANLPDSSVSENVFDAYEEDTADSMDAIREWLKEIGY